MKTTIGRKIALAFLLVMIVMLITVGIVQLGYKGVVGSLERMEENAVKRGAAGNLRFSVAQMLMAVNDYIITEKLFYHQNFDRFNAKVDESYNIVMELPLTDAERQLAQEVKLTVDSIRVYAYQILAIAHPRSSLKAATLMEKIDYEFGEQVNRKTTEIFELISRRISSERILAARYKERALNTIYVATLLMLSISITVVILSINRISKPILSVTNAAREIANGNYSVRTDVSTRDEISLLAKTFSQMAEALQQSHRELKQLSSAIEQTADCVIITDRNGIIQYVNSAFEKETGYTKQEALGKSPDIIKSGKHDSRFYQDLWETILAGNIFKAVFINRKKNGVLYYEQKTITPLKDEQGKITHFVSTAKDITDQVYAEQALRKSEERYRELFESTSDLIQILSTESKILYTNRAWHETLGYRPEELAELTLAQIVDPNYLPHFLETIDRVMAGEKVDSIESLLITKQGRSIYVEGGLSCRYEQGKPFSISYFLRDLTERKKAEEEIKRSKEQYERFFMENLTGDYISKPDGRILACNPAFIRIFGFSLMQDALATNVMTLLRTPQEREKLLSRLQRERKLEYYELQMVKLDGTTLYLIANIIGRFDENDRLVEMQGYLFDDTKRRQLEEGLRQIQKLESIGTLASGIAHDFNNILGIIMGHSSLLKRLYSASAEGFKSVDAIYNATCRGADLVKQLLTFARKTESIFESVNVNDIIHEIITLVTETFPKIIAVSTNLQKDLPAVSCDAMQIHQVILNLCVNARDAMPKGGSLAISTSAIEGSAISSQYPKALAQKYVQIEVTDTGLGMDETTRQRIFEPFFTTKAVGKGTGLGLSLVYGIIETQEGFINVKSKLGKGTTFTIYLPIPEQQIEFARIEKKTIKEIPGGRETILLIEDEEGISELIKGALESKGYTVFTAADGKEGADVYAKHLKKIDLVVSDLGLPLIGGEEVFKRIKSLNPDVKVILASGFIDPTVKSEMLKAGAKHFILKPYLPAELLQMIREILDSREV